MDNINNTEESNIQEKTNRQSNLNLPYVRNPRLGLGVLFAAFFIMLTLVSIAVGVIGTINGDISMENGGMELAPKALRILIVIQDLLVFILPAIVSAMVVTRLPANLLTINVKPRLITVVMTIMVLFISMPAMDYIIRLNESVTFPESLAWLEDFLRGLENGAGNTIEQLAGESSIGNLIMGILIIGILTGISEELFFRGAMQNLFMCTRMRRHLCIWVVAVIFSFMHFQFFGFIPRVLLGAYFGYLIWWTGSVWTPIIAHAANNSIVVVFNWIASNNSEIAETAEESAALSTTDYILILASTLLTALFICQLRKTAISKKN